MFSMDNEFAYIITDTSNADANIQPYFDIAEEGYNLAFIYNNSNSDPEASCDQGLRCIASDIGNILVGGYDVTLKTEMSLFEEVSLI